VHRIGAAGVEFSTPQEFARTIMEFADTV